MENLTQEIEAAKKALVGILYQELRRFFWLGFWVGWIAAGLIILTIGLILRH